MARLARLDSPRLSACIVTDHEHPNDGLSNSVVRFVHEANILIHDAQFTPREKRGAKSGWGHSSWKEAALTAREAKVKQLFLTHHDPDITDETLKAILKDARQVFPNTEIATEASVFEI